MPIPADVDASPDHVEIEVGGLRIAWETQAMIHSLDPEWQPGGTGRVSVAFEADSPAGVDEAAQRVKAAGYVVKTEPWDAPWGQRCVTVTDPDDVNVDVFAWLNG